MKHGSPSVWWLSPRTLLALLLLLAAAPAAQAEEPVSAFAEGLRERGYYDTALDYLEGVAEDASMPAELRAIVPYEKALTLQAQAKQTRNPDTRAPILKQAEEQFEAFLQANPNHERAAKANAQLARLLLDKAETEIIRSRSPANETRKGELQAQARQFIGEAREVFQTAHDQYQAEYESFDTFIEEDDPAHEQRAKAEYHYIKAQLDLALCTYHEAQTYDEDAPEHDKLLLEAADQFRQIHEPLRSQVGGLHARMWEAKCYEETGDLNKADGIYNELLSHEERLRREGKKVPKSLESLTDQVLQFKLELLNRPEINDYLLAHDKSREWLSEPAHDRARYRTALGIRWQSARAQEMLAEQRTAEAEKLRKQAAARTTDPQEADALKDRAGKLEDSAEELLEGALKQAELVSRYRSPYQEAATFAAQELQVKLHGESADPEDFTAAFGLAAVKIKEVKRLKREIEAAESAEERNAATGRLREHLEETARILQIALRLANAESKPAEVNKTRYYLSYVNYSLGRYLDGYAVGEYVGRRFVEDDPETARDASFIALASAQGAYVQRDRQRADVSVELALMERIAKHIVQHWPDHEYANKSRIILGDTYQNRDEPVEAAKWYTSVRETSPEYNDALILAGSAYWQAYGNLARDADRTKSTEELNEWKEQARTLLAQGAEAKQAQADANETPPELVRARYLLANIAVQEGRYQDAIDRLSKSPHSVLQAIQVPDESQRPQQGITGREFAGPVYQMLLRGYVGTQDIEKAMSVMDRLEQISGGASAELYKQLGEQLEREIEQIRGLGEQARLQELRTSFEQFLAKVFAQKEGQSYGVLKWVASTYFGLGQGIQQDDPSAARGYFDKAAEAYQAILDQAANDPEFVDASRLPGDRLRLVTCRRAQGEFEIAYDLVVEVLAEKPNALDAQFEAARVFQSWGDSGVADAQEKYKRAIRPSTASLGGKDVPIWGWQKLILVLRPRANEYGEELVDAEYNLLASQFGKAKAESSTDKRNKALAATEMQIKAIASSSGDLDDENWDRLNGLYRSVLEAQGKPPVDLERPKMIAETPPGSLNLPEEEDEDEGKVIDPPRPPVDDDGGPSYLLAFLMFVLAGGGAVGLYFVMNRSKPKRRSYGSDSAPVPSSPAKRPAKQVKKKKAAASAQGGTSARGSGGGTATKKKKAAKKKPSEPAARKPVKKKKRPPSE